MVVVKGENVTTNGDDVVSLEDESFVELVRQISAIKVLDLM